MLTQYETYIRRPPFFLPTLPLPPPSLRTSAAADPVVQQWYVSNGHNSTPLTLSLDLLVLFRPANSLVVCMAVRPSSAYPHRRTPASCSQPHGGRCHRMQWQCIYRTGRSALLCYMTTQPPTHGRVSNHGVGLFHLFARVAQPFSDWAE